MLLHFVLELLRSIILATDMQSRATPVPTGARGGGGSRDGPVVRALAFHQFNVAWVRFPLPVSYVG